MTGFDEVVAARQSGSVLVVTINRPDVRNAVDRRVAEQIHAALARLDEDPGLRVGILAGAGDTFCSGMDLKAFANGERPVVPGYGFAGLAERPPVKPLVAAVEGYALAGGFEIVLCCDLVVASKSAVFGLPEVRRGLTANGGGLMRLPARVPYHLAMEFILTGRHFNAQEAKDAGLVNVLTEPGDALVSAMSLAEQVAANAPRSLMASKQVVIESPAWPPEERFQRQEAIVDPVRKSADAQEGARAFIEKRAPVWTGQ